MLSTEKTLSEVIEVLRQRGYTEDFNLGRTHFVQNRRRES